MKFLKIVLIIVLLIVMCSAISLGTGTITSGDKTVYMCPPPAEYKTLNEWFAQLSLREKIDVYEYWTTRVYSQDE